jgi:hypothetical protein
MPNSPFNLWAQQGEAELLTQARVTKQQAKRIERAKVKRGTIKSAELEKENGMLIWSFDVAQPGKKDLTEDRVDATTGKITAVEAETPWTRKKKKRNTRPKNGFHVITLIETKAKPRYSVQAQIDGRYGSLTMFYSLKNI